MEERTTRSAFDLGGGLPAVIGGSGIGRAAAIVGVVGAGVAAGYFFFLRRRRPPTLAERVRETLRIGRPVVVLPNLAATTQRGMERGRWFARLMARQARPSMESAGERAREAAESAQRLTQQLGERFQHDVLPRARELPETYGPIALERSRELGNDLAMRFQESVLPLARGGVMGAGRISAPVVAAAGERIGEATRTVTAQAVGLPGRLLAAVFGGIFRLMLGVFGFFLGLAALVGLLIFIYAPERRQREQLLHQVSGLASGVGEFISDVRHAFVETEQAGA